MCSTLLIKLKRFENAKKEVLIPSLKNCVNRSLVFKYIRRIISSFHSFVRDRAEKPEGTLLNQGKNRCIIPSSKGKLMSSVVSNQCFRNEDTKSLLAVFVLPLCQCLMLSYKARLCRLVCRALHRGCWFLLPAFPLTY